MTKFSHSLIEFINETYFRCYPGKIRESVWLRPGTEVHKVRDAIGVCVCVCEWACMCACLHVCECAYVRASVCVCARAYVYVCVWKWNTIRKKEKTETRMTGSILLKQDAFKHMQGSFELVMCLKYN